MLLGGIRVVGVNSINLFVSRCLNLLPYRYNPVGAGSFIPLPSFIQNKKCTVNVENRDDQKCMIWSILTHLHWKAGKKHKSPYWVANSNN